MADLPSDLRIVILAAPSGAGKTTIAHALMEALPQLMFSISATTRTQRKGETDGEDYYFLTQTAFESAIANGDFVEYEEVYEGRFYGTLKTELQRIHADGGVPLFDVDVKGALNLKSQFGPRALNIFIDPPSLEELELRLRKRGTETEHDLQRRLDRARFELSQVHKFDEIVPNYDLDKAVGETIAAVKAFLEA